jgi:transcriptional regulator with GAF, ATPase, and Fis domain
MAEKTGETLEKELAHKAEEFRILQRVSSEINSTLDLDEIYDIALRTMDELFEFHHSIILLLEQDAQTLTVVASRGYEGQAIGGKVRLGVGVIGIVAQKRKILLLNNLGQSRSYVAAQRRQMIKAGRGGEVGETVAVPGLQNAESQIAIPLLIKDDLIGVFSIESPVQRTFDEHDRELVTIVANQIASAIHNARLYRTETGRLAELARKTTYVHLLQRVAVAANAASDLNEALLTCLREICKGIGWPAAHVYLPEGKAGDLVSRGLWHLDDASRFAPLREAGAGARLAPGTSLAGRVLQTRKPEWIADVTGHPDSGAIPALSSLAPGSATIRAALAFPVLLGEEVVAVVELFSDRPVGADARLLEVLAHVGTQLGRVEERRRAGEALRQANELLEQRVRERTLELERKLRVAQDFLHDALSRLEGPLLGDSAAVRALREGIAVQAASFEPLLLVGAPGSGKEVTARAVHDQSARRDGPFIFVSCPQLHSSEVAALGGSPTTGGDSLMDKLDLAAGGTLYLDAVHELPQQLQAALQGSLADLERARAQGETRGARVIASTTRDLAAEVTRSRFDPRLHQFFGQRRLVMPALAERIEDIPALVMYFVRKQARQLGKTITQVSDESMRRLLAYKWPGNIRELRNVVERAMLVARGPTLEIDEELLDEGVSLGSYRLVERIGSGGMGEVWLAKHRLIARGAAVKLIRAGAGPGHDTLVQRFQREARVTANLRSPNTVQLYDYGVSDTGDFYYVMELLAGMDLQQMVDRFGPLPPERVIALLVQACRSLGEAHESGLVHRDIKPANLFVTRLGLEYDFLKVLDFGMVKGVAGDDVTNLTAQGYAQGTPAFMAPELALGETEVDGRADLYSLGCAAYCLLTGRPVFDARNAAGMLMHHVQSSPIPPSRVSELEIPERLEALVMRCLEKRPERRPDSALALQDELGRIPVATPWSQERAREWWRMHAPEALAGAQGPR